MSVCPTVIGAGRSLESPAVLPLPDYLRPVLWQLLSGATDCAASHHLNMSPRTFSRRVAELLEFLDVQTRFQAGFEVARRARIRESERRPDQSRLTLAQAMLQGAPARPSWDTRPPRRLPVDERR
jgi:hypothetical protein